MSTTAFTLLWPTPLPRVLPLPLFSSKVAAGFPSPADDYVEKTLDLNELLVQKPAATFFVRAQGESMLGAGIHPNDILVVDRSIEPVPGKIVICALNGELTVKRLERNNEQWQLKAENPAYPDIAIHEDNDVLPVHCLAGRRRPDPCAATGRQTDRAACRHRARPPAGSREKPGQPVRIGRAVGGIYHHGTDRAQFLL